MTRDILSGEVNWRGQGVINPFSQDGSLVDLEKFPRLERYLEERREVIARRHVAKRDESKWYRTIDRIHPELATRPKLLIPDIKGEAHVVFEPGRLYPHHNLYFIVSESWDLRALQAVLMSGVARFFVSAYSTKMRGGFLRFQAQYLRKIRIPEWESIPEYQRQKLLEAAASRSESACNQVVAEVYGLSDAERRILFGADTDAA